MTAKNTIEEIKNYGHDIDFSDVFSKSFENYKRIALQAGIVFILFGMVVCSVVIGTFAAFWCASAITETMDNIKLENLSPIMVLLYILVVSLLSGLVTPISAGIMKMADQASANQEFSIATAFDYYRSVYFKELFVAPMLISVFTAGTFTLLQSVGISALGVFITYVIYFFTFLTIPLIIFGNLKAIDAIQGSCIIVSKQFLIILGLLIVAVILSFLGMIGFCIGIFFTLPFLYSTYYCIYDEIIGSGYKSELEDIGKPME